ncbi:MAG: hypothetical protein ACOVN0_10645 [Niveispirillum sp.]|uniref:hypothetical protein n=1 Tax=Niveispirillum sp. TaxID=1917217 RepID=UPI003BA68A41
MVGQEYRGGTGRVQGLFYVGVPGLILVLPVRFLVGRLADRTTKALPAREAGGGNASGWHGKPCPGRRAM